jgi:3-phenylpropionate/trans-cinnamate dioxygenase ferredoxin reductase component
MAESRIVVVGGGLATARLAKAYRENGGTDPLLVISADVDPPYHRPPLSKRYLRGEIERDGTLVEQESFYSEHDVELRLETAVTAVRDGSLELDGGERVPFGRLVIASGATPKRLTVPGADLDGVFTLRALSDSTAIRERARQSRKAVIVGTGFIGLEVAASLRALGLDVTIVDEGTQLFRVVQAPPLSKYLAELYREHSVELVLGEGVAEFLGSDVGSTESPKSGGAGFAGAGAEDGRLRSVVTASGRVLDADLCVVGIGVTPNVGFLEGSGLAIEDGVVVNERYEASVPGVHAVGDVARFFDPVFGRRRRIEHWSNANYQGSDLGKLLAGAEGGYDVVSSFFTELFGKVFKVFGDTSEHDELVLRGNFRDGHAVGFYLSEGRIVAALTLGQDEETETQLKDTIRARLPLAEQTAI